jgi:hypothetical protein
VTLETTFLGLIALATTVMAVLQIAAAVYTARAARDATRAARELMRDVAPILANARRVTDDAARVTALALTQVERVDTFISTTTVRVDDTLDAVQSAILGPLRQGTAVFAGIRAALAFFLSRAKSGSGREDDEESLFIG